MNITKILTAALISLMVIVMACGGGESTKEMNSDNNSQGEAEKEAPASPKGIGPVDNVDIPENIDTELALRGQEVFEAKCTACHEFDDRYVGPPLAQITNTREPEWIMNMILNPEEMTKKDPIAKALYEEYLTQMTFQDVTEEDARAILEYFRQYDKEN